MNRMVIVSMVGISVLEAASHNYISLFGVGPELSLIGALYFAINSGRDTGAVCGLIAGFLKMVFYGAHPLAMVIYAAAGFIVGAHKSVLYKQTPAAQAVLSFTVVMCVDLIYGFLNSSMGLPYFLGLFQISFPSAIYTSFLTPPVFKLLEFLLPPGEIEYKEIIFKKRVFEGRRPQ